jgi:hypothetical protein
VGAAIILVWPAHWRYSASLVAVTGPTAWTAAFAIALADRPSPAARIPAVLAAAVLGACARPEGMLLGAPLVVLPVAQPGWRRHHIVVAVVLIAAALVPALLAARANPKAPIDTAAVPAFLLWVMHDVTVGPPWWIAGGVVGLLAGRGRRMLRAALGLALLLLVGVFLRFAAESNPLFGLWRYFVFPVPLLAVGGALAADRLEGRLGLAAPVALAIVTAASGLLFRAAIFAPVDMQAEFAYVRETAGTIAATFPDVVLVGGDVESRPYQTPMMALADARGPQPDLLECDPPPVEGAPRIYALQAVLAGCARGFDPARAALFLGRHRPPDIVAAASARFRLEPLDERIVPVKPVVPLVDTACAHLATDDFLGTRLADCQLPLGWYRLVPR